jgi:RNA polymerase subunit RPABC4/transcription elongation factor Spt4
MANYTCPKCNASGSNFEWLGQQQMKCGYCNAILTTRAKYPSCGSVVIAKWDKKFKNNPFLSVILPFKALTGQLSEYTSNQVAICPQCKYKSPHADWKTTVLIYGNKSTVNEN